MDTGIEIKLEVGFLIKLALITSPNGKMSASFKRGATYLLNLRRWSHNYTPSKWIYTHQHMTN